MLEPAERPQFLYVTYIAAAADRIFAALTDGAITRQYFFGRQVESAWRVGLPVRYWQPDGRLDVEGKVIEYSPPLRLSFTWHLEWIPELRHLAPSRVSFNIEPLGPVVRLTLAEYHVELVEDCLLEAGRRSWPVILSGLKTLLETGHPLPPFQLPT